MSTSALEVEQQQPQPNDDHIFGMVIGTVGTFLVSIWIILVTAGQLTTQYVASGIATTIPNTFYVFFPVVQGVLLLIPLLPLAIFVKHPIFRAVFQTWLTTAVLGIGLSVTHLTRFSAAQFQAAIHIIMGATYALLILALAKYRYKRNHPEQGTKLSPASSRQVLQALILSALFAYPWLAWGALGSLQDTIIQTLAALVLGLVTALIIEHFLARPIRRAIKSELWVFILEGFTISITLVLLTGGTGFPFGAMQLLLALCISALGWATSGMIGAAAGQHRSALLPIMLAIGLSLAAPFSLIDPDELYLIITASAGETLSWAFNATIASTVIAALIGLGVLIARLIGVLRPSQAAEGQQSRPAGAFGTILWAGILLAVWAGGITVYFAAGQPGLYGEGMFIILKDQGDVSQAVNIEDYEARRQYVYDTLVAHADTTQADLRQALDHLGLDYTPYYLVNAIQVKGNVFVHLWLLTRPEVDRVLENPWLRPLPEIPPEGIGYVISPESVPWNITLIEADRVWQELGVTGEGIIVGQSDSGAQGTHPNLTTSYRGRDGQNDYNWYDPWYFTIEPTDIGGHGTHTLGTILGKYTGVAPGATWYACVNLARNLGNPALYLDCMQFMLAPFPQNGDPLRDGDPSLGAHVINNSWGCPEIEGCDATSLLYGVRNLRLAGIFVVASAGNDGPYCDTLNTPPAIYDEAFSVGAIDQFGQIASFSSIGPVTSDGSGRTKPDIMAPGVNVFSSMPGSTYAANSGTSMAGPHVVGLVALMWSANPALIGNIDATEQIIVQTASPYTGTLPDCPGASSTPSTAVGYGVINAYEAVKAALSWR